MKLLVIAVVLFACSKKQDPGPDRWPEVERLATPSVPGGDGALLDAAMKKVTEAQATNRDAPVPEDALADAIAWRKANGGLSWRNGGKFDMAVFALAQALIERGDDEAVDTVLYLSQRLRAEAPRLIEVTIGFTLITKLLETKPPWKPAYGAYAPTEAEIRRGIAADGVNMLREAAISKDDIDVRPIITRHYQSLVVGAPTDRAAFLAHVEAITKKAQADRASKEGAVLAIIALPRLHNLLGDFYKAIDDYRTWGSL